MSLMPICTDLHFVSLNINDHLVILCYFLPLLSNDLQVVVYEGAVGEKPFSKEEVLQFLKGLLNSQLPPLFFFSLSFSSFLLFSYLISLEILSTWIADYFGGHAATVGSVLVTNLKSGFRKGEWDQVEVPLLCETLCNYWVSPARNTLQYVWLTLSNLLQIHSKPQKFWY